MFPLLLSERSDLQFTEKVHTVKIQCERFSFKECSICAEFYQSISERELKNSQMIRLYAIGETFVSPEYLRFIVLI